MWCESDCEGVGERAKVRNCTGSSSSSGIENGEGPPTAGTGSKPPEGTGSLNPGREVRPEGRGKLLPLKKPASSDDDRTTPS